MTSFKHQFLNLLPPSLEPHTLYVSMEYGTVVHLCACGCGSKVVTPLSPKDWKLIFDGNSLTLSPSIGNWQFPCRSHYWIRDSKVKWAANSNLSVAKRPAPSVATSHLAEKNSTTHDTDKLRDRKNSPSFWRRLKRRWRSR